jgi:arabinan endo-1,5-alpha-L-arabinosidase
MFLKSIFPICLFSLRLFILVLIPAVHLSAQPQNKEYPIPVDSLNIRDPFIVVDQKDKSYYVYANRNPHIQVYKSKDLKLWKDLGPAFSAGSDFWGKSDFWAPDVYFYQGKYYMLTTFSAPGKKRGTSILVSEQPFGPFKPLVNHAVTPADMMSLDAMLYVDDHKQPWLIYCHEWVEVENGTVVAQRLSADLQHTISEPEVLFNAKDAPWTGEISGLGKTGYVTDGPFPYRMKNGELIMIWSSFNRNNQYAVGIVRSVSGKLSGPWKHDVFPLNDDHGGHAMLFNDLDGKLKMSYHSPNSGAKARVKIVDIQERDGLLKIKN